MYARLNVEIRGSCEMNVPQIVVVLLRGLVPDRARFAAETLALSGSRSFIGTRRTEGTGG